MVSKSGQTGTISPEYSIIPRISVPFFFIVSGYFFFPNLHNKKPEFLRYIKKLGLVYLKWSLLYFFIDFILWGYRDLKGYLINSVVGLFYYGSYFHFWFFPALIYSVCLAGLLWNRKCKKMIIPISIVLYITGVLGCAYFNVSCSIPILQSLFTHPHFDQIRRILLMGFPFFSAGYTVHKIEKIINKDHSIYLWIASLIAWILEIVIVIKMNYQKSIVLTFFLYPLVCMTLIVLLQNPLLKWDKKAEKYAKLSNFTYYAHPLFILMMNLGCQTILGKPIPETLLFLFTVTLTFIVGSWINSHCKYVFNNPESKNL